MRNAALLGLATVAVLSACATSTSPGTIGVTRTQLMIVPTATVNAQAALEYSRISDAARKAGKLNSDAAVVQRVRGIASSLIREVGTYRPDAAGWAWEVNVYESPALNAFCAPGGKIGIFTGIITSLQLTDDEIAAIMGHEIAHALREHSREKASQAALSNAVVQGIANSGSRNAGTAAAATNVGALFLLRLPFSREMESEADVMGLELMARAGFDPRTASNVWRKMQARGGGSGIEFMNTHPSHDRRIADLEAAAPKVVALFDAAPRRPSAPPQGEVASAAAIAPAGAAAFFPGSTLTTLRAENTPMKPVEQPSGQESYQVEQMARREGCSQDARAVLTAKGAGFETYTLVCKPDVAWSVRCDFGNCRVLK